MRRQRMRRPCIEENVRVERDSLYADLRSEADGSPPQFTGLIKRQPKTVTVDSLAPRLAWEAIGPDKIIAPGKTFGTQRSGAEAQDVRYDLRVWHIVDGATPELVYERTALPAPEHQLEQTLEPHTEYLGSVRARFTLDGHPRALDWAAEDNPEFSPSVELMKAVFYTEIDDGEPAPHYCSGEFAWTPCKCLDFIPLENYYRFKTP
jgi:hypothetical protein